MNAAQSSFIYFLIILAFPSPARINTPLKIHRTKEVYYFMLITMHCTAKINYTKIREIL